MLPLLSSLAKGPLSVITYYVAQACQIFNLCLFSSSELCQWGMTIALIWQMRDGALERWLPRPGRGSTFFTSLPFGLLRGWNYANDMAIPKASSSIKTPKLLVWAISRVTFAKISLYLCSPVWTLLNFLMEKELLRRVRNTFSQVTLRVWPLLVFLETKSYNRLSLLNEPNPDN